MTDMITKGQPWKPRPEGAKDRMGSTYGDEFFEFTVTNGAVVNLASTADDNGNTIPTTFDKAIVSFYNNTVRRRFSNDPTAAIGASIQAPRVEKWEGCASDAVRKMRLIATGANALVTIEIFD